MSVRFVGGQRLVHPKHQFIVEIFGFGYVGFQTCSELSMEVAKIEYWEGGSIIPWKHPGRVTMTDLTLERGTSNDRDFYDWSLLVANAAASPDRSGSRGSGNPLAEFMRDADIIQLDRDANTVMRRWKITNAWAPKFTAGDWDNNADEVVIEQLILTFDYFSLLENR